MEKGRDEMEGFRFFLYRLAYLDRIQPRDDGEAESHPEEIEAARVESRGPSAPSSTDGEAA